MASRDALDGRAMIQTDDEPQGDETIDADVDATLSEVETLRDLLRAFWTKEADHHAAANELADTVSDITNNLFERFVPPSMHRAVIASLVADQQEDHTKADVIDEIAKLAFNYNMGRLMKEPH